MKNKIVYHGHHNSILSIDLVDFLRYTDDERFVLNNTLIKNKYEK